MYKLSSCFVAMFLLGLLIFTPIAVADPICEPVTGTGHTFATGPTTFQGTAVITRNGQQASATVITNVVGAPKVGDDGTLLVPTSHTFTFADGSINTLDHAVLSPTPTPGVYALNSRLEIANATGSFENICGRMSAHGSLNFNTGEAIWRVNGRVCNCE